MKSTPLRLDVLEALARRQRQAAPLADTPATDAMLLELVGRPAERHRDAARPELAMTDAELLDVVREDPQWREPA